MIDPNTPSLLRQLALDIFNLNLVPNDPSHAGLGAHFDPTRYTGIRGWDASIDQRYYNLISPLMQAVDGNTMQTGIKYTMNFTCALYGRPKHWFLQGLYEFKQGPMDTLPAASVGFQYDPLPGEDGRYGDHGSYGFTIGTACAAGICNLWALIGDAWIAGTYPRAVTPFSG